MIPFSRGLPLVRALGSEEGGKGQNDRRKDDGHDGQQLDQDVDGGAGGVLEGVPHRVADHRGLVLGRALAAAVSLLKYPGNIWLFSPDNSLKIVPSSSAQYKKARKRLRDFNRLMPAGQCVWKKDDVNLRHLIAAVRTDLTKSAAALEEQVVEHGSDWVDNRADDLFYYNQGKMYAYMLVLKALSTDFKQILLDSGQYQTWTEAIRALEDGTALSPFMVRNGNPGSVFAANHLIALGYYMLSGANILGQINLQTEGVSSNED